MWVMTSFLHKDKGPEDAKKYAVSRALQRIDASSILFFLGILLAVSALESFGLLKELATILNKDLKNDYTIGTAFGLVSSVVDNVPLVAAAQGMYDLSAYPTDHSFWQFITLTTGTGGSLIIIGSAAGIAAMSMERIHFGWYLKRISWLALLGFAAGISVFLLQKLIS
jgi:Na+/H+ antiporter NhaD/arsenite permease-like protein